MKKGTRPRLIEVNREAVVGIHSQRQRFAGLSFLQSSKQGLTDI
jgi:hypothetical protein